MVRPYSSHSINELEILFTENAGSPLVIAQLRKELSFRSTKRAQRLIDLINESTTPRPAGQLPLIHDNRDLPRASQCSNTRPDEHLALVRLGDFQDEYPPTPDEPTEGTPDDRNRPRILTRIRPVGTLGLPDPWARPFDQGVSLHVPPGSSVPQLYCAALKALVAETKRTGAGQKRYELEKGSRMEVSGATTIYEFAFTEDAGLFEDTKVDVEIPGQRLEGSIVSISAGRLRLAIGEDLGPVLHRAVILVDATALLEALRERIEQVTSGELPANRAIADAIVGAADHPPAPSPLSKVRVRHDAAQQKAIEKASTASITYIWGPPGTGKTTVLGQVVRAAFDSGKRVLICSNTNRAVDHVLLKICNELTRSHSAMEAGSIVRLGPIALDTLTEYAEYVTVDGIVERKSSGLKARRGCIQDEITRIDSRSKTARTVLARFHELESVRAAVESHTDVSNSLANRNRDLRLQEETVLSKISKLEMEITNPRTGFFGWIGRSKEEIKKTLSQQMAQFEKLYTEIEKTNTFYAEAKHRLDSDVRQRNALERELRSADRTKVERDVAQADSLRAALVEELQEIDTVLTDISVAVLKEARVLGTTCTKTYLSAKALVSKLAPARKRKGAVC